MSFGYERAVSFRFVYSRYNAKEGERVEVTNEGDLSLGMGTSFSSILDFKAKFAKAYNKACKMVAEGEDWDEFRISVADYAWNSGAEDFLDYHSENFDSWVLSRAYEQGDPKENGYLYAQPDERYTESCRDLLVYSDIFKTLA